MPISLWLLFIFVAFLSRLLCLYVFMSLCVSFFLFLYLAVRVPLYVPCLLLIFFLFGYLWEPAVPLSLLLYAHNQWNRRFSVRPAKSLFLSLVIFASTDRHTCVDGLCCVERLGSRSLLFVLVLSSVFFCC